MVADCFIKISIIEKTFLSAYRVGCYNNSDGSLLESMVCIKDFGQDLKSNEKYDRFISNGRRAWMETIAWQTVLLLIGQRLTVQLEDIQDWRMGGKLLQSFLYCFCAGLSVGLDPNLMLALLKR